MERRSRLRRARGWRSRRTPRPTAEEAMRSWCPLAPAGLWWPPEEAEVGVQRIAVDDQDEPRGWGRRRGGCPMTAIFSIIQIRGIPSNQGGWAGTDCQLYPHAGDVSRPSGGRLRVLTVSPWSVRFMMVGDSCGEFPSSAEPQLKATHHAQPRVHLHLRREARRRQHLARNSPACGPGLHGYARRHRS